MKDKEEQLKLESEALLEYKMQRIEILRREGISDRDYFVSSKYWRAIRNSKFSKYDPTLNYVVWHNVRIFHVDTELRILRYT